MVEINFLCVHKKLRSKRVAPVLIREITRRVNEQGIFQAVYTAGVVIPKPLATCRCVFFSIFLYEVFVFLSGIGIDRSIRKSSLKSASRIWPGI